MGLKLRISSICILNDLSHSIYSDFFVKALVYLLLILNQGGEA